MERARKASLNKIGAELDELVRRQAAMSRFTVAESLLGVTDAAAHWKSGMTLSQRRGVISALVEITLLPSGHGRPATAEHIKIVRNRLVSA